MTFGTSWGFGSDREESQENFVAFLEAGGNFIDTANKYTNGESETILGELMVGVREKLIISTKYSLCTDASDPNSLGNHRRNLVRSVEDSLLRLKTDYLELLWVHAWYFENEVEDVARALDDLIASGKVLYWGMSDTPAWVCAEAEAVSRIRGWAPLSAIQVEYSLVERTAERELLPFANHKRLGITGFAPLAGGILSGKHHLNGSDVIDTTRADRAAKRRNPRIDEIVAVLTRASSQLGVTPSQLALSWIGHSQPNCIPILGARRPAQLKENLGAMSMAKDDEVMRALDEASRTELGFPHDMLASPRMQEVMYGPFARQSNATSA